MAHNKDSRSKLCRTLQSTVWQGQVTAGDDYKHDLARNISEDNSRHFKMKALTSEILVQEALREQQINEGLFVWLWD